VTGAARCFDPPRPAALRLENQRAELASALERIQALATRDDLTGLLTAAP